MSPDAWENQYAQYYRKVEWHLAAQIKNDPHLLHLVMAAMPLSVLEVGAGTGKACALLKRLLPETRVVASDISPEICRDMNKFMMAAAVQVEVKCCDLFHMPYDDLSFDVCFSEGVMEHFTREDIRLGITEQLRVAKIVIIVVPLLHWFFSGLRQRGDEAILSKRTWIDLLYKCGTILDISFLGPPLEELVMIAAISTCPGARIFMSDDAWVGLDEEGKFTIKSLPV